MKRLVMTIALAAGLPAAANAATCEQGFVKKGNPVTGLRFIATTNVPGDEPGERCRAIERHRCRKRL
jgi:hypothetical protein